MKNTFNNINIPEKYQEKFMLNAKDIQDILQVSSFKAYNLCDGGHFPIVKLGQTVRVSTAVFFHWLNSSMYIQ